MEADVFSTCMLVDIGLTRDECASWVQAWGSIFAIFFSIGGVLLSFRLSTRKENERQKVIAFIEAGLASSFLHGFNNSINAILEDISGLVKVNYGIRDFSKIDEKIRRIEFLNGNQMLALFPVGMDFAKHTSSAILLHSISLRLADRCVKERPAEASLRELHGCLKKLQESVFEANRELIFFIDSQSEVGFK